MEVTPQNVGRLSEEKAEQNLRFRHFLKESPLTPDQLDRLVLAATDEVWAGVDCTRCANCCKQACIVLDQQDVGRLATHLGVSGEVLIQSYLEPEEDPDQAGERWQMRLSPCPFLKDNRCSVYEARPAVCGRYPYLHEPDFVFRMLGTIERAETCPIVFEVLERMKDRTGFDAAAEQRVAEGEWPEDGADDGEWPELRQRGEVPWAAIRVLAGRLARDHELLENVLARMEELVVDDAPSCGGHELVYLAAAVASAAISGEERPRAGFALTKLLEVAQENGDELAMRTLSFAVRAAGEAATPETVEAWVRQQQEGRRQG